jgi:hypothetical protein
MCGLLTPPFTFCSSPTFSVFMVSRFSFSLAGTVFFFIWDV